MTKAPSKDILLKFSLNKKRKNQKIKVKNGIKIAKYTYKTIKTTNICSKVKNMAYSKTDLFPMKALMDNIDNLYNISRYISDKINKHNVLYRTIEHITFVEYLSASSITYCMRNNITNIEDYIGSTYNFNNILKKEKRILVFLLLNFAINYLCKISKKMRKMHYEIKRGANLRYFSNNIKYSNALVYGIAKYNQNVLKYINISGCNVKKCVFLFIKQLNNYANMVNNLLKIINKLLTYNGLYKLRCRCIIF